MVAATSSCRSCGCDLSEVTGFRCPMCGARINRAPLPDFSRLRASAIVAAAMFACSFGLPVLIIFVGGACGVDGERPLLAMAIPYSVLLGYSNLLPLPLAVGLGMLQGPIYGLVMVRSWPPYKHPLTWLGLVAIHAIASLAASSCLH